MKKCIQQLVRIMPWFFILALIVVTILMMWPFPPNLDGWTYTDKVEHMVVFVTLTLIGAIAYMGKQNILAWGLLFYGGAIEIMQGALTTTREASWADWAADAAGIVLGLLIYNYLKNSLLTKLYDEPRI